MHLNELSPGAGFQPTRHTVNQIEKERELEAKTKKLHDEFDQIDSNHNEYLERNEIKEFLDRKVVEVSPSKPQSGEHEFDDEMIDAIIDNLDKDRDG